MSNIIIDWDTHIIQGSEMQIIDIYPTNLIEIPFDEYDLAEFAYYEGLSSCLTENGSVQNPPKNR